MILLTYLIALIAYVLISIWAVSSAIRAAKRRGARPWLWGVVMGLAMYNLAFWDLIPNYAKYSYLRSTQAGLWVYTTPGEWKSEFPEAANHLTYRSLSSRSTSADGTKDVTFLNQRINQVRIVTKYWPKILRKEDFLIDIETGGVLAKHVYFQSGDCRQPLYLKFWLSRCIEATGIDAEKFMKLSTEYKEIGENLDDRQ
jgi:hypothetical protein